MPPGRLGSGTPAPRIRRLLDVTREALDVAVHEIAPGRRWSQVARKMQELIESNGFGVVKEFVGHGIGQEMHEEPKVPNYYDRSQRNTDFELRPGMTLAIEPMVTAGRCEVMPGGRHRLAGGDERRLVGGAL